MFFKKACFLEYGHLNLFSMTIHLYKGDLPDNLDLGSEVAIDTETQGLNPLRDRLCVVQLSSGDGQAHLVQLSPYDYPDAKNLKALLTDKSVTKIFHFARFDIAALKQYLGVDTAPVFCTKIASKLVRTYTDRHGLKDLLRELSGIELDKKQQSSDWATSDLSEDQQIYAANDVYHLNAVKDKLVAMLKRENRIDMAQRCFEFLPTRAELDLNGWDEHDIFSHS
jgi:ribonuclease D